MDQETIKSGKTLAILSYFTFIGLIIAIFMNMEKRNSFVYFHCRQMLGLVLMLIISNVIAKYGHSTVGLVLWGLTFAAWLFGLISSLQGKAAAIPYIGDLFQKWFRNIQ